MLDKNTLKRQYCIALLSVVVAFVLRLSLNPLIGTEYPFPLFFFAIIVTAYCGSTGPTLLAVAAGYLLANYFFIDPPYSFAILNGKDSIGLASYLATSLAIHFVCSKLRAFKKTQVKLQTVFEEQNKWLGRLINASPDILFVFDVTDYHLVYSSKEAHTLLGLAPERLIALGSKVLEHIVDPEDLAGIVEYCRRFHSADDEEVRETEGRFLHADGSRRVFQIRGVVFSRCEDGRVKEIIGSCRDITEQKRTENILRASEEEFRTLFDVSENGKVVVDCATRRYLRVNQKFCELTGYTKDELLGMTFSDLTHPEDRDRDYRNYEKVRQSGNHFEIEKRYRRKDGTVIWVWVSGSAIRDTAGNPLRFFAIVQDISERKRAEKALRESELRLQLALSAGAMGIWDYNLLDDTVYWDRQSQILYGFDTTSTLTYERVLESIHPEDRERVDRAVQAALHPLSDGRLELEYRIRRPNQSIRWIAAKGQVSFEGEGEQKTAVRCIGTAMDVTLRKQAEEELREAKNTTEKSLAQVRAIISHMTEGLVIADPEGRLLEMNQQALDFHGFDSVEQVRKHMKEFENLFELHTMDEKRVPVEEWPLARALRGETFSQREYRVQRKDIGKTFYGSFGGTPVRDKDGRVLFGIFTVRDVTERIRMEQSLRESEQRFRAIFENARVGIGYSALNGGWIQVNSKLSDILGYAPEELLRRTNYDLTHPDDLPVQIAKTECLLRGEIPEISMRKRYLHKSGDPVWVHLTLSLVKDKEEDPPYLIGVVQDISAQVEAEEQLKNLNQNLEEKVAERTAKLEQQSEKLRRLTVEITHAEQRERQRLAELLHDHLQQILVAAMMRVSRTQVKVDRPELRELLEETRLALEESIRVSRSLTAELLPPVLKNGGLAAALQWLARNMKKQHNLEVELDLDEDVDLPNEPMRILLFQTVRELLFNIIKHAQVSQAALSLMRTNEEHIHLSVSDAGVGFDLSVLERDQKSEGGFGLFSVRERLQIMGGQVEFQTQPGKGTRVTLTVPRNGCAIAR